MPHDAATETRTQALDVLGKAVAARASSDRQFRRAIGTLTEDLAYIRAALLADPDLWRLNRAFHAVHVPSLHSVVLVLEDVDQMASVTSDDAHQMHVALSRAALLARAARERIEQAALTDTQVELDVLASQAPTPAQPLQKPSMFIRAMDGVASASETAWDGARSGAAAMPGLLGSLQDGVTRAGSVPVLARNLQKTVTGAVSDAVTRPLSMRLSAGQRALQNGLGAGVGLGVVIGVLCPPLLPLSAGGAVLAAMRTWRRDMDRANALNAQEKSERIAQLQAERAAALKQLTEGASALQMENEDLSLTVDVETGEADAVILRGEYEGRMWSSLSVREKAELAVLLANCADCILGILRSQS